MPAELALDVHAGLRAVDDAPCLIVTGTIAPEVTFEVGGMRLAHAQDERGILLVLSLEDRTRADLFTTVCADVLDVTAGATGAEQAGIFLARLEAWRRFLRERRSGLSQSEVVGIIGELLILRRLLQLDGTVLSAWTAPDSGLHDFNRAGHALEIKTTVGVAGLLRVSSLEQLDASGLERLDLIHVRLSEAPGGQTLGMIADDIATNLQDAERRTFENALLRRGLMPDDNVARLSPEIRLQAITAFTVIDGFPRLVPGSVPLEVVDASYALELRAIAAYAVDAETTMSEFVGSRRAGE